MLHQGTATAVFEAADENGADLIVKRLSVERAAIDPIGIKRFEREIALCAAARHPGLAQVVDHTQDWIAFERLEHAASDDRRKHFLTTAAGIKGLVGQLAETLAYLHSRGIVHRDVKPAHVMFRGQQSVLIDLGVAGLLAEDPLDGTELVGSPAWMAPEQIAGAIPAASADIWSLCAVGAALIRGRPLFSGSADGVLNLRRNEFADATRLSGYLEDDPKFKSLLESGLGRADTRPSAAEIATALRSPRL